MPKIQLKQKARHEMEEENSSSVFISLNSDKNKKGHLERAKDARVALLLLFVPHILMQ